MLNVSDMRVWSYKITRDYGFAPNPFFGWCTLACCKPRMRRGATVGDLIVGCGSAKLKNVGHVIFAMRVTEKMTFDAYWQDNRFHRKRASYSAGKALAFGDNIYHHNEFGDWVQEDSHHSYEGGLINERNSTRDLGADAVLISNDFIYWGASCPEIPAPLRNFAGDDLYPNTRDVRNSFAEPFKAAIEAWFNDLPRGRRGRPHNWR